MRTRFSNFYELFIAGISIRIRLRILVHKKSILSGIITWNAQLERVYRLLSFSTVVEVILMCHSSKSELKIEWLMNQTTQITDIVMNVLISLMPLFFVHFNFNWCWLILIQYKKKPSFLIESRFSSEIFVQHHLRAPMTVSHCVVNYQLSLAGQKSSNPLQNVSEELVKTTQKICDERRRKYEFPKKKNESFFLHIKIA